MNTLDIIALVIFSLSVVLCAIKGLLKLVAQFGSLCVAFIAARLLGGWLGELIFGESLGGFAVPLGTVICFIILLIVCRIIFGAVAKLITKLLHTNALDKILGGVVGAIGGVAGIYLLSLGLGIAVTIINSLGAESTLPAMIEGSLILKYFM